MIEETPLAALLSNAGLGLVTCRYCGMPPLVENGKAWCIKAPGDVMTIKDWQNWNAPPTMQTKQWLSKLAATCRKNGGF
jgi:hypothetical protein